MDSVSQFALGAAIGEVSLGARLGRRAMLLGGLLGTLPDLDVLVQYTGAVESFTYHRSWSHSLFVLGLLSFPIAFLLMRAYPKRWLGAIKDESIIASPSYLRWLCCVFLILTTHPILDAFTIYGTQLFWPLPLRPVSMASVFIIDLLYTLPLLIGLWLAYKYRKKARTFTLVALLVSSMYLGCTLILKQHMHDRALDVLSANNISHENVLVAPGPIPTLWRVLAMDGDLYHEGFSSLLDASKDVHLVSYESNRALIDTHYDHWPIARLDWFTNGLISADRVEEELVITDLRMGMEANYVFRFFVGRWNQNEFEPLQSEDLPVQLNNEQMLAIITRAWDESIRHEPYQAQNLKPEPGKEK